MADTQNKGKNDAEEIGRKKPGSVSFGGPANGFFGRGGFNRSFGGKMVRRDFTGFRRGSR